MATVLALDIGERKIGVARANTVARIAEPLATLTNDEKLPEALQQIIANEQAEKLVVGLPRGMDGQATKQTQYVEDFINNLHIALPVVFQDEAVTSIEAEKRLQKRKKPYSKEDIDAMAASVILEDYLGVLE